MHERILDAAEKKFREHGYLKVTVADVAHDLNMSPANVYRFFDSKASLRESLVYRLTHQVEEACGKVARGGGSASERLEAMIVEYHRMTLDRYLSAVNAHEMLDAAIRENWGAVGVHTAQMRELIEGVIQDGVRDGEFHVSDVDCATRMVNYAIIPFIDPGTVALMFADDKNFIQVRQMSRFILGALRSGSI